MFSAKEFIKTHKKLDKQFRKSFKFKSNDKGFLQRIENIESHIVYRDNCGDIFECMENAKELRQKVFRKALVLCLTYLKEKRGGATWNQISN